MNLFDNIIKNAIELQILSIILDTSDIKKFYYRGVAHIWNCSMLPIKHIDHVIERELDRQREIDHRHHELDL